MRSWRPDGLNRSDRGWLALMAFAALIAVLAGAWPPRLVGVLAFAYAGWRWVSGLMASLQHEVNKWHDMSAQTAAKSREWREQFLAVESALADEHAGRQAAETAAAGAQRRVAAVEAEAVARGRRIVELQTQLRRSAAVPPPSSATPPRPASSPGEAFAPPVTADTVTPARSATPGTAPSTAVAAAGGAVSDRDLRAVDLRSSPLDRAVIELNQIGRLDIRFDAPLDRHGWAVLHRLEATRRAEMSAAVEAVAELVDAASRRDLAIEERRELGELCVAIDRQPESATEPVPDLIAAARVFAVFDE